MSCYGGWHTRTSERVEPLEAEEGATRYARARQVAWDEGYTEEPFRTCYAVALMTEAGWTRGRWQEWRRDH